MRQLSFIPIIIMLLSLMLTESQCVMEPDREFIYEDTLVQYDTIKQNVTVHDTVKVYKDTLTHKDTVYTTKTVRDTVWKRDTTKIHDTTIIHDTVKTFATNTLSSDLVGTWQGTVEGKTVTLTIVTEQYSYAFSYTANIGTSSYDGKIQTFSNNIAKCVYMYGPNMIAENANWMISISNNVLTLQQTGYAMFPTMNAFQLIRIF